MTATGLPGRVSHCGVCGSWDLRPVLDMGSQPLPERYEADAERYPLALVACRECTLVQLSFIPPPRDVFPEGHTYSSGNTRALRDHFASLAAVAGRVAGPGQLVADLGCNDGTLLDAVRREVPDVQVLGVEPTGQAAKAAAKGIEVCQEFFTVKVARKLREMYGPAKVVTAANVLAHVADVHDFMAGVTHLLADDGTFITENHDVAAVLDGLQIDAVYHEHARYYSLTSLSRLLGMHGLAVTAAEKIGTHGGSFRVHARRQRTGSLEVRARGAVKALRALLDGAVQEGPVYGIGAATRATPLIHYAGIAEYLTAVAEVAGSDKLGKVMPGTSVPVVDEALMLEARPPWAVLFAWPWADSIVPALRKKGYAGRIVIPLPEPRVISD